MLDRQKVEAILARRFPGALRDQVAAAANAIMGLPDEWEEIAHEDEQDERPVYHCSAGCGDLMDEAEPFEFRLFRRRLT